MMCLAAAPTLAQTGNSPYSRFALGELAQPPSVYSQAMGGIGVSNSTPLVINGINPALLARNRVVAFEAAFTGEHKYVSNADVTRQHTGGNLGYLAFAFPIAKRWTAGAGLRPFSAVNYQLVREDRLPNTPTFVQYTFRGTGSISQAYFASGFEVYKGLFVGAEAAFNFGGIRTESRSRLLDTPLSYTTELVDSYNFGDLTYKLGAAYRLPLSKDESLNFGVTYNPASNVRVTQFRALQRLRSTDEVASADTLLPSTSQNLRIPQAAAFGISYEKAFKYTVGVEYSYQNWSEFASFEQTTNTRLTNTYKLAAGGEIIPNIQSVNNYFARVAYRAGAYYALQPVAVNGKQIDEFGINFGLSLPVNRNFSSVNLSFAYGRRGTTENGLIRENFFRFNLGLTVNDPLWFQKRKIN
ncbi:MAG: hypothetical protein MUC97_01735 [Bernardetiaceae bacterium]|nr:hypothetical protein [Bernardetiaceae bacterium]